MNQRLYLILTGFSLIMACKPSGTVKNDCAPASGQYINQSFFSNCKDKMPYDVPSFSYELTFSKDSVHVDNGFENFDLPVVAGDSGCIYKIVGATSLGDMSFKVLSDSSIQLMDTEWTKNAEASVYQKVTKGDQAGWGFTELLNDCKIAGEYALFKEGELQTGKVVVLPNGQLSGMKPFIGYSICYAGDCVGETEPPSPTITLTDDTGKSQTFAFKNVEGKMAIELYSIADPIPDVKGERPIGKMVYELRSE